MMLFDPAAALAEIQNQRGASATSATSATQQVRNQAQPPATHATFATQTAKVANVAEVSGQEAENRKGRLEAQSAAASAPRRLSVGGRPMTQTGRIVSLQEWAELSRNRSTGQREGGQ